MSIGLPVATPARMAARGIRGCIVRYALPVMQHSTLMSLVDPYLNRKKETRSHDVHDLLTRLYTIHLISSDGKFILFSCFRFTVQLGIPEGAIK